MTSHSTHAVEFTDGHVVKRFRSWDRGEHQREWLALNLLTEFAPGLAPAPVSADLDADPPSIRMTRVAGEPLADQAILPHQLDAIAAAVSRLHSCVPPGTLARVPPHPWLVEGVANHVRSLAARPHPPDDDPRVRAGFDAARHWLDLADEPDAGLTPVFGQGDSNLANFLWDGERVRLVDFEDSGRNDRAFELAALTEHISFRHDTDPLLARFDLTANESARVLFFRRAFAIFWLLLVRDRPGSVPRLQAERVLDLLASAGNWSGSSGE
jgi:aminoglycoside phosphotransferase